MDLGALFGNGGGSIDFFSLLNRAFEQMAHELARHENVPGLGQQPPEELLATTVGNRLARMIVTDRMPGVPARLFTDGEPDDADGDSNDDEDVDGVIVDVDEELVERNLALAAALGACDCWGQDPGCRICQGEGGPGWLLPDRQLFAAYVYPALRAIRAHDDQRPPRPSATNTHRTTHEPKENGYVRHPR